MATLAEILGHVEVANVLEQLDYEVEDWICPKCNEPMGEDWHGDPACHNRGCDMCMWNSDDIDPYPAYYKQPVSHREIRLIEKEYNVKLRRQ